MFYTSTRNSTTKVTGGEAIANGIATDGGLYVPSSFPNLSLEEIELLGQKEYAERCAFILDKFLDFGYDKLLEFSQKAYARFEDKAKPCPLKKIDDITYVLELFHGPTLAFKDMALTLLPHLMTAANAEIERKEKTLILVATSGDTGKAALEGFKDVENTAIAVFYPAEGVSDMQKMQMQTQEGSNVLVCGIDGNFDDAQNAVKRIFVSDKMKSEILKADYRLSSANSINWGRLAPQIVYYFSAYVDMVNSGDIKLGDKINFCVPSGNFGNILAGYYAKQMGLPINKLICASNKNNVLTDFFTTGEYNANRDFYKTASPSMDILVSSNLERLLFEVYDRNSDAVVSAMNGLKENSKYTVDVELLKKCGIEAGFATEEDARIAIDSCFDLNDYLMDPHTAVAMVVYNDYYARSGDETPTVIVSTASPYKFPQEVLLAISHEEVDDAFIATKKLHFYSETEVPMQISSLQFKTRKYTQIVDKSKIDEVVLIFTMR